MGLKVYFLPEGLFEDLPNIVEDNYSLLLEESIKFELAVSRGGISKKDELSQQAFEWFLEKQDSIYEHNMWEASKALPLISLNKKNFEEAVEIVRQKLHEYGEIEGISFKPAADDNGFEFFKIVDFYSLMGSPVKKKVQIVVYTEKIAEFNEEELNIDTLDVDNFDYDDKIVENEVKEED